MCYEEDEWYEEDTETRFYDLDDELEEIAWKLDVLYGIEYENAPFVDDGVRGEIYALQDQRDELKRQIANSTAPTQPLTPPYPTSEGVTERPFRNASTFHDNRHFCDHCGKMFYPGKGHAIYCSNTCRQKAYRARKKASHEH